MIKKIWNELKWASLEAWNVLLFTLFLFFAMGSVVGSMFGIAWMIDEVSHWNFVLYIPWFILLFPWIKFLVKPFAKLARRMT